MSIGVCVFWVKQNPVLRPTWHPIPYMVHYGWPEPVKSSALYRKKGAMALMWCHWSSILGYVYALYCTYSRLIQVHSDPDPDSILCILNRSFHSLPYRKFAVHHGRVGSEKNQASQPAVFLSRMKFMWFATYKLWHKDNRWHAGCLKQ